MKAMNKKIIAILPVVMLLFLATGCKYDERPPKTSDAASDYILPQGDLPTEAEMQAVQAARDEYESSIN